MRFTILSLFTLSALCALGQPSNDQCANVTPFDLAVGSTVTRTGTRTGATTANDGVPGNVLMTTPGAASVWEAFTTTTCSNVTVRFCDTPLPATTMWNFLSATCPADVSIFFSYANFGILCANGQYGIAWYNLPAGTYYLPIYCTAAGGAYTVEFASAPCAPGPANDDCAGAVPLAVNLSCAPTAGSVANGTFSFPAQSCNGATGDSNDDVWFSFVATGPEHTITVEPDAGGLDAVVELYAGPCASPVRIACADATFDGGVEVINATDLEAGQTYRFRVFHYYTALALDPDFTVCVTGDIDTEVGTVAASEIHVAPTLTTGPVVVTGAVAGSNLRVLDGMGRLVHQAVHVSPQQAIDLSGRPAGTYMIVVEGPQGAVQRTRVVVQE